MIFRRCLSMGSLVVRESARALNILVLLAILMSLSPAFSAWGVKSDPIDTVLDTCISKPGGNSTAGMVECVGAAIDAWNRRLNETYQRVLTGLDARSQKLLSTSQRRWLAFREAEHATLEGPWRNGRGSLVRLQILNAELSAIKERVQELRVYGPDGG
jgi:uncharacterized protein YecT (DUF1311 family)